MLEDKCSLWLKVSRPQKGPHAERVDCASDKISSLKPTEKFKGTLRTFPFFFLPQLGWPSDDVMQPHYRTTGVPQVTMTFALITFLTVMIKDLTTSNSEITHFDS